MEATLGADQRFVTNALRIANRTELVAALASEFDENPLPPGLEKLARAGVPAAPINSVPEALNDAQTLARGMIVQLEHPSLGQARSIANPITVFRYPGDLPIAASAARRAHGADLASSGIHEGRTRRVPARRTQAVTKPRRG